MAAHAQLLVVLGDFDYLDDPARWEAILSTELGPEFLVIAVVGNHDVRAWTEYQALLEARTLRSGVSCRGDIGVNAVCIHGGVQFVTSGVGTLGFDHVRHLRESLAGSDAIWRVCAWHKPRRLMQVGGKLNEVPWEAYDTCRRGGAIIASGHEHSYSRTYLMRSFVGLEFEATPVLRVGPGVTFAFVSGLGGRSVRHQVDALAANPWWAAVYTADQGARPGALFCRFNAAGEQRRAICHFRDIAGNEPDRFEVISEN